MSPVETLNLNIAREFGFHANVRHKVPEFVVQVGRAAKAMGEMKQANLSSGSMHA